MQMQMRGEIILFATRASRRLLGNELLRSTDVEVNNKKHFNIVFQKRFLVRGFWYWAWNRKIYTGIYYIEQKFK